MIGAMALQTRPDALAEKTSATSLAVRDSAGQLKALVAGFRVQ